MLSLDSHGISSLFWNGFCVLMEEPPLLVLYLIIARFIYLQSLMDYTLLED